MRNQFTPEQLAWIAALESGEYKQGRDKLFDGVCYCCLGVGAVAAGKSTEGIMQRNALDYATRKEINLYGGSGDFLIPWRSIGLTCLAELNDNAHWTFPQIAGLMRAHPWLVFSNFDQPDDLTEFEYNGLRFNR